MDKNFDIRQIIARNWSILALLALLSYFVTHAFMGAGSVQALRGLQVQEATLMAEAEAVRRQRDALQDQVDMLSSEAIDPDFLEESVRHELGYVYDDEVVLFINTDS